jgi:hypothetical protein
MTMTPKDAADHIRESFHLESMPAEARHHIEFVEAVADELGVEHTPFNLQQVAEALDKADIHPDSNEWPKMLYSRQHHTVPGIAASIYEPRWDMVHVHVDNEDQAKKLGSGWIENPAELPPRGDTPIHAPMPDRHTPAPSADPASRPNAQRANPT